MKNQAINVFQIITAISGGYCGPQFIIHASTGFSVLRLAFWKTCLCETIPPVAEGEAIPLNYHIIVANRRHTQDSFLGATCLQVGPSISYVSPQRGDRKKTKPGMIIICL
jgi:hypothetical protein